MNFLLLTKSTTFIIGPIASLLGYIMNAIYAIGVHNVALCIIIFTFIVNLIMLPLTINQQKSTKVTSVMQPELTALQNKYKNKKDQASMQKMQAEQQAIYDKYGASPTGGCLTTIIQLPIMFALYQVIYRIPAYVKGIKEILTNVAVRIMEQPGYISRIAGLAEANSLDIESVDYTDINKVIDLLGKFNASAWEELKGIFPSLRYLITENANEFLRINTIFGGLNLTEAPGFRWSLALLIPVLAGVSQWVSTRLLTGATSMGADAPGASSMRMMNNLMPIISVIFCFTFPIGIGIYWVASSCARIVLQLGINQYMKKVDVQDLIKQNIEKKNRRRARRGQPPLNSDASAKSAVRSAEAASRRASIEEAQKKARKKDSSEYYDKRNESMGSVASRARMVQDYNERKGSKGKK